MFGSFLRHGDFLRSVSITNNKITRPPNVQAAGAMVDRPDRPLMNGSEKNPARGKRDRAQMVPMLVATPLGA
jgi:hypothetical protein